MDVIVGPLLRLLVTAVELYMWCVIIGVILSWLYAFNVINPSNRFVYMVGDFINRITEPALAPIRRILPNLGNIDVSPLVLILILYFLQDVLIQLAYKLA